MGAGVNSTAIGWRLEEEVIAACLINRNYMTIDNLSGDLALNAVTELNSSLFTSP